MDLSAVYAEIETKLKAGLPELRVVHWGEKPQVPGAMVLLPDGIARTNYRGMLAVTDVVALILVGKAVARQALKDAFRLGAAAAGGLDPAFTTASGAPVVWTSCTDVTITDVKFDTVTVAGAVDAYLGVLIHMNITGTGA